MREVEADRLRVVEQVAHYRDFGSTFACETLAERHGIVLSVESVRNVMCQKDVAGQALQSRLCRSQEAGRAR